MKKVKRKTIVLLIVILLAGAAVSIVASSRSYCIYVPDLLGVPLTQTEVRYSDEGIVRHSETAEKDGYVKIVFSPLRRGSTTVTVVCRSEDGMSERTRVARLNVGLLRFMYDKNSGNVPNLNGYPIYYVTLALLFGLLAAHMFLLYRADLRRIRYSYEMVYRFSLGLQFAGLCVCFAGLSVYLLFHYREYQASTMRSLTTMVMLAGTLLSTPIVIIYSISMTISNIALIRHEGFRAANALGIAISVLLLLGVSVCIGVPALFFSHELSFQIPYAVISTVYVFFEMYLVGTQICALKAARRRPAFDKDYIIILGCGIRRDGSLTPLLKGRVDKAVAFYRGQLEATGKKAVYVPSGGQGRDEAVAEGEAMRRYLLEQGVPGEQIMPELKSTSTIENMLFSKRLIGEAPVKAAFSTTNYHVFRSGICSVQAGLDAEGMGSKTRWYFWPNAFIREFAGLLADQRKKIISLVALAAVLASISAYITF